MVYFLAVLCIAALLAGQLLFKAIALRGTFGPGLLNDPVAVWMFVAAIGIYGVSTIVWIFVLKKLPLSTAYPFVALGFAVMPFAARFVFNEPLTRTVLLGTAMIVAGIVVIFTGRQP